MKSEQLKLLNRILNDLELLVEPSPFSTDGKEIIIQDLITLIKEELKCA